MTWLLLPSPATRRTHVCVRSKSGSAPPHFTVTIYPELVDSKGVALLRGDVVSETIVNPQEVRKGRVREERLK